ncbi:ArsR/SmtB family transcription factor, partial [Sphaerisporangium flaviroseum]
MDHGNIRKITDSRVLAALAHPLRRRLMDVLKVYGPSTASMLADRTGQAVANVSHHLRVLGASELIEEAPELARDRRERWWRLVSAGVRWTTADF